MCFVEPSISLFIQWQTESVSFYFFFLFASLQFLQESSQKHVLMGHYAASQVLKCLLNDVSCHLLWLMSDEVQREECTYTPV